MVTLAPDLRSFPCAACGKRVLAAMFNTIDWFIRFIHSANLVLIKLNVRTLSAKVNSLLSIYFQVKDSKTDVSTKG